MFRRLLPLLALGAVLMNGCTLIVEEVEVAPTEVRVSNELYDLNMDFEYYVGELKVETPVDDIDLHGVWVGGAHFDAVLARETTPYKQASQSGNVEVLIDSVMLSYGTGSVLFNDIDGLNIDIKPQQQNTLTFDGTSLTSLLGALGKKARPVAR